MAFSLESYQGPAPPFTYSSGPRRAAIAIVGEAFGQQEELTGMPFIGASGQELTRLLSEAGIARSECFLTNVFPFQPGPKNDLDTLCVNKAEAGLQYPMPLLRQGKYIHPKLLGEVQRLKAELSTVSPNLIIALGNTACWAILARTAISSIRGTITEGVLLRGSKVLPTYHPSAVLRNWSLRTITLADLLKAERESHFPEIIRPFRQVLVSPGLAEISEWFTRPANAYAVDIETWRGQITMIGFARSPKDGITIPFIDSKAPGFNYWPNPSDETSAWQAVAGGLESAIPKIFQNGVYDIGYLLRMGFRVRNALHDTMLHHHALYPELQKGLGFMGSIYSNEASWKLMRHGSDLDDLKRDE